MSWVVQLDVVTMGQRHAEGGKWEPQTISVPTVY
jgi:hypothetical protein